MEPDLLLVLYDGDAGLSFLSFGGYLWRFALY